MLSVILDGEQHLTPGPMATLCQSWDLNLELSDLAILDYLSGIYTLGAKDGVWS